ncbi:MAG: toxin-antitoxin system YwqK family antitoxin [Fidelibacterota bacterium]
MKNQRLRIVFLLLLILTGCDKSPAPERQVTATFSNGKPERVNIFQVVDGQKKLVKEETYYFNGQMMRSRELKDGYPHGVWREWFNNGQLRVEKHYRDGNLDGLQKGWYRNGAKFYEAEFAGGKLLHRREWKPDGTLRND